jgi:hypothetical protein
MIEEKFDFGAEWNDFDDDGRPVIKVLLTENILEYISQGCAPEEIAEIFQAPMMVVEHAIMQIPVLMAKRSEAYHMLKGDQL